MVVPGLKNRENQEVLLFLERNNPVMDFAKKTNKTII